MRIFKKKKRSRTCATPFLCILNRLTSQLPVERALSNPLAILSFPVIDWQMERKEKKTKEKEKEKGTLILFAEDLRQLMNRYGRIENQTFNSTKKVININYISYLR